MIIQPDFLDHWKTQLLIDELNDPCAPIYLIRLWGHCQSRKTHIFDRVNDHILKSICKAPHNSKKFEKAMIDSGFIRIEGSSFVAHDWDEVNASLVTSWENGKKGGRPSKKNPRVTHGIPTDNPSVTDREEKRRLEEKDRVEEESFERVWEMYDKKQGKEQAKRYWLKLSKADKEAIEAKIPAYVNATPDKKFRKHMSGWINPSNRLWEDEIVTGGKATIEIDWDKI